MPEKTVTIKLAGDATELNAALQQSLRSVQDFGGTLEKVGKSHGIAFSSAIQQDVKQLEVLRDHLVKINAPAADLEKVTKKLTEAQLKFKDSLKTDAMKAQEAALESLSDKYKKHDVSLQALGKTITDNRAGFQALGGTLTAIGGAITGSLGLSAKAAIDFESAFAGVRKTVDASEPEFKALREQFLKMSTEIPVSVTELAKLGEVAGQLGIKKENIASFARVIADLGISSNLAGEEGATMLAQFGNIVGLDQSQYSNLASSIVFLGNSGASTEKDIAAMGLRLAAAGDTAGLSAPQILGVAAALADVGLEAEAGGTAFSQLLIKMQKATKEGGDSLKAFSDVTKLVGVDFKKTFEQDASKALTAFLKGVDQLNKSGANTFGILEGMGVEGIRLTDAIIRASNANDKFEGSIRNSSKAFQENTALSKEAAERYKTVESQLAILGNTITALAVRIGEAVLPAIQKFVDLARPIIATVTEWATANPTLTASIVAVGGAIGGLMLAFGPLVFALPTLVESFGLMKVAVVALGPAFTSVSVAAGGAAGALTTLGSAVAVAATAFAAWNIGRMIGEIEIFGTSIDKLAEKFFTLTTFALQNATSLKETEVAINRTAAALKNPVVRQAGEDWAAYQKRVLEAAKSEAVMAVAQAQAVTATKLAATETKKGVAIIEQSAEAKKKQADAAKKAAAEIQSWGNAIGVTIPKLRQTVAEGEKYVAYLKRNKASATEVQEAERKLNDARLALTKATSPLIAETEKLLTATKDLDKAEIANISTLAAAQKQALSSTQTLRALGAVVGTELPAEFGKPTTALLNLESAFKTLGITSDAVLRKQVSESAAAYESIAASGTGSAREIALAWVAMTEAQITAVRDAGGEIDQETLKAVESIKAKYGGLKGDKDANLTSWREIGSRQVSTLVSDVSKGFADILTSTGSFGSKITAMFKNIGAGILQGFFESGIGGLLGGKGLGGFAGFAGGLLDAVKGIFRGAKSGSPAGGLASFAGMIPGLLTGKSSGLTSLAGLAPKIAPWLGIGASAGSIFGGASAGASLATAGLGGVFPGFLMAGSTVPGITAGGTAAASAGGASMLSSLGALFSNPITGIVAGGLVGGLLLRQRLTRRGREKEEATGEAENLSANVWGTVEDVKSGNLSVDEGIAAVKQYWADYETFLKTNLKDQTVIQRSLDGQRVSLTESLAALEAFRKESSRAALGAELEKAIEEFGRTGALSQAFSDLVVELGGNIEEFKKNIADTSKLEGLRAGFGGLRDELIQLKPATEDMFEVFLRTGEVTEDLQKAIDATGLTARAQTALLIQFKEYGKATDDLADFTKGIGSLRAGLESLAPPLTSAYQSFLDLNEITPALRDEINRFGLDISAFESFSAIKTLRDDFTSLRSAILTTGEGAEKLKSIFESVGADTSILGNVEQIGALRKQQGEWQKLLDDLSKIAPPKPEQKTDLQRFWESGEMTPQFIQQLTQSGADVSKFSGFTQARSTSMQADALVAQFEKTGTVTKDMRDFALKFGQALTGSTAQISDTLKGLQTQAQTAYSAAAAALGIEVGKIKTAVETEIGKLQTGLELALDAVGTKLNDQFEDSRLALIAQLQTVDTNLTNSVNNARDGLVTALGKLDTDLGIIIGGLKTDLTTAINNLTAAVNNANVPGGNQTGQTPATAPITPTPTTHTFDRSFRDQYGDTVLRPGFPMAEGGEGVVRKPTWFLAGEAGPERFAFEPLSKAYGKSEALQRASEMSIAPAVLASIQRDYARTMAVRGGSSSVDNSKQVSQTFDMRVNINGGADPFQYRKEQDRMMAELVNRLNV